MQHTGLGTSDWENKGQKTRYSLYLFEISKYKLM